MALAHSRCTSCAAPRRPPRITILVIRSAAKTACLSPCLPAGWADTAMSQARTSCNVSGNASQKVELYSVKQEDFTVLKPVRTISGLNHGWLM